MKRVLISFRLCPFVQRSVIVMREKNRTIDIEYIDLAHPPRWFVDISPFGKVPLLKVDNEIIFESSVISEYLDEITPPSLQPSDPLWRAINRSWTEFASELITTLVHFYTAATAADYQHNMEKLEHYLARLEAHIGDGPFFNGRHFQLIDAAFAPFFTRASLLESVLPLQFFSVTPKIAFWATSLINRDSVKNSVEPDFNAEFLAYVAEKESYVAQLIRAEQNKLNF